MNTLVRLAALGILSGCASHAREGVRITLAPVAPGSVTPVAGALALPSSSIVPPATICDIDSSACEKQSCAAVKTSCGGKAACAGHP